MLTPGTTFINIIFHEAEAVYSSCKYPLYIGECRGDRVSLVSQAKNLASLEAFCIFTDVGIGSLR